MFLFNFEVEVVCSAGEGVVPSRSFRGFGGTGIVEVEGRVGLFGGGGGGHLVQA